MHGKNTIFHRPIPMARQIIDSTTAFSKNIDTECLVLCNEKSVQSLFLKCNSIAMIWSSVPLCYPEGFTSIKIQLECFCIVAKKYWKEGGGRLVLNKETKR